MFTFIVGFAAGGCCGVVLMGLFCMLTGGK